MIKAPQSEMLSSATKLVVRTNRDTFPTQLDQPFKVFVQQNGWRQLVYTDFRVASDEGAEVGAIMERGIPVLRGFAALINIGMPRTFHVHDAPGHDVWVIKRPAGTFGRGPRLRHPDGTAVGRWKRTKSAETGEPVPTLLIDGRPAARVIPGKASTTIVDPSGIEIVTIHHVVRNKRHMVRAEGALRLRRGPPTCNRPAGGSRIGGDHAATHRATLIDRKSHLQRVGCAV